MKLADVSFGGLPGIFFRARSFGAENGGKTLADGGPVIINPIYTLYSGYLVGIFGCIAMIWFLWLITEGHAASAWPIVACQSGESRAAEFDTWGPDRIVWLAKEVSKTQYSTAKNAHRIFSQLFGFGVVLHKGFQWNVNRNQTNKPILHILYWKWFLERKFRLFGKGKSYHADGTVT